MITTLILLDPNSACIAGTLLRRAFDLPYTRIILNFANGLSAAVVFLARFAGVEWLIVRCAHQEAALMAAKNIAVRLAFVELTRAASGSQTVLEFWIVVEDAAGGELLISVRWPC
jgi:hypothetical protein